MEAQKDFKIYDNDKLANVDTTHIVQALNNIKHGLNRSNKAGVFNLEESHQLYNDLQLVTAVLVECNNKMIDTKST